MDSPIDIKPNYIASTDAAQRYGLSNDHIASLCRRKKVAGALAGGRLWFVDEDSLKAYLERTERERAARHRQLSEQIRREQSAKQEAPHWNSPASAHAFALALFIVGSFYVSAPMVRDALADVPWHYVPSAMAAVSADLYDRTFVTAAVGYMDGLDEVGDVQARSYLTIARSLQDATHESFSSQPAATAAALPDALASTMVDGFAQMLTWYAQRSIDAVLSLGDLSASAYEAAAVGELRFSDALVTAWVDTNESVARHFVSGLDAFVDGEAYTMGAVIDTMSDSSDTIGAAVASAIRAHLDASEPPSRSFADAPSPAPVPAPVPAPDLSAAIANMRDSISLASVVPQRPAMPPAPVELVARAKAAHDAVETLPLSGLFMSAEQSANALGAWASSNLAGVAAWYDAGSSALNARLELGRTTAAAYNAWTDLLATVLYPPEIVRAETQAPPCSLPH